MGAAGLPARCLRDAHTRLQLNLVGPEGPQGPSGETGLVGPKGDSGETGTGDHSELTNLSADDHPQYLLAGVRAADDGFAVTGTLSSGAIPTTGAGTRLMWSPAKAAFRAGAVGSAAATYWDDASIGTGSVAFGQNTRASGMNSFAVGGANTASGQDAVALGSTATASGDRRAEAAQPLALLDSRDRRGRPGERCIGRRSRPIAVVHAASPVTGSCRRTRDHAQRRG